MNNQIKTEQEELTERLDAYVNYLDLFESELTEREVEALESDIDIILAQLREMEA